MKKKWTQQIVMNEWKVEYMQGVVIGAICGAIGGTIMGIIKYFIEKGRKKQRPIKRTALLGIGRHWRIRPAR